MLIKIDREQKQQNVLNNKKALEEEKQADKISKVLARESMNRYREIEKLIKLKRE